MGKLTNLNPPAPITDADLPASITHDAEYIAGDKAHLEALDPHLQYPTQERADARYGLVKKFIFTGLTATTQGANAQIAHGLVYSKILSISGLVDHGSGLVESGHAFTSGYQFSLSANASFLFIGNAAGNWQHILNKPIRIVVDYSIN